jgi:hypothetical protein
MLYVDRSSPVSESDAFKEMLGQASNRDHFEDAYHSLQHE